MSDELNYDLDYWLKHIESFHPREIELGLERIKSLAEKLGLITQTAKVVLVGGTNGKGSCVAMLESLALSEGIQVATYTSPHLLKFNERIRVNGVDIGDKALVDTFALIEKARGDLPLTFFEFTTLAALAIYKNQPLELIVLEVGLGGRLDAVNIVEPDISIITTIDIDHTDWLGGTLDAIAREKAGISRVNKTTLVGDEKSFNLLDKLTQTSGVDLRQVSPLNDADRQLVANPVANPNRLLAQNVMLAYQAMGKLFPERVFSFESALKNAFIRGRFQWLKCHIPLVVDVAHNPQAATNLALQIGDMPTKGKQVIAICGMMADKAIAEVIEIMQPQVDRWCFVDLPIKRAIPGADLLAIYHQQGFNKPAQAFRSVAEAFDYCQNLNSLNPLILAFGSFITVANMIQYIQSLEV